MFPDVFMYRLPLLSAGDSDSLFLFQRRRQPEVPMALPCCVPSSVTRLNSGHSILGRLSASGGLLMGAPPRSLVRGRMSDRKMDVD